MDFSIEKAGFFHIYARLSCDVGVFNLSSS